ncbi:hypothetical protein HPB47_026792 [Ixodes persulcatus]|uniref:Uncharacterized protein n=1 Tax=Ixodes persulcatus TaxID=34615 RepID=A0AC60PZP3_IXOPE|nr:hypothetical protein HPB47_026792 [Ixodes persulcatus]
MEPATRAVSPPAPTVLRDNPLGYSSGRFGLIGSAETRSLNVFVSYFALPAVAFKSLATIALGQVNWKFLAALALGKAAVFVTVAAVTLLLVRRPLSFGKAGLYAIAATQSNDFGLGYPLISHLFDRTQPTFSHYLYLVSPIQLAFLNPIAFLMMEYSRSESEDSPSPITRRVLSTVAGIFKNPVVLAPALGILWNVATSACALPYVFQIVVDSLGDAFIASTLFLLGLNMVGQLSSMGKYAALTPVLLITAKILVCPLVIREIVNLLQVSLNEKDARDFGNFGFLYGMIPMAPSVFIFATQYGLPTAAVSTAMVAGTFLSAPFIFISATMSQISRGGLRNFFTTMGNAMVYSGAVSTVCCLWLLVVLGRKRQSITHGTTFFLVVCQLATAVGGVLWIACDPHDPSSTIGFVQSALSITGIFASRIWTAIVAALLMLLHWRSLCFVLRMKWLIVVFGFGSSFLVALSLCLSIPKRGSRLGTADPNFQFGDVQAIVAVGVLLSSLVVTIVSMVFQQRFRMQTRGYAPLGSGSDDEDDRTAQTDVTSSPACSSNRSSSEQDLKNTKKKDDSCTGDCENCGSCSGDEDHVVADLEDILNHSRRTRHHSGSPSHSRSARQTTSFGMVQSSDAHGSINTNHQSDIETPSSSRMGDQTADLLCGPQFNCDKEQVKQCLAIVEAYHERTGQDRIPQDETCHQVFRHLVLLLLLSVSMVVGLAVSFWQLLLTDVPTGILVELEFLDIVLNYGQGMITFLVFGLDAKWLVRQLSNLWNCIAHGPRMGRDTGETRQISVQFRMYHYASCVADITAPRRGLDGTVFQLAFVGRELVDWLIAVGLCQDRTQALRYGKRLLDGRVIRHAVGRRHFQDEQYTYVFLPSLAANMS